MTNINDYGAPDGWQIISLGGMTLSSCTGDAASTIKHEVQMIKGIFILIYFIFFQMLHALGFHHEHNRPDRATFLDVDLDATDADAQFQLMGTSEWVRA